LHAEIGRVRQRTNQPFGVNLTILPTLKPVPYDAYLDAALDAGITIIETAGNNPQPFLPRIKARGARIIHKCTSVRHAQKAQAIGCDAVSIDGFECAGHPGEDDVPGLILIPAAAEKITVPMIASGGFGDGRGLVAALALGADGINMGTRFMVTKEAPVHENVKQAAVRASERDTQLIFRRLRNTARIFRNGVATKVAELEARPQGATIEELAPLVAGSEGRRLMNEGDLEAGIWSAGQVIGLIHDVPTVRELVDRIVADAEAIIARRLGAMRT
jgi:nitronate monooxygenase